MKIIKHFAFAIRSGVSSDGKMNYFSEHQNDGVPEELVIMQMEALLRTLKKRYFDNYDKQPFKGGLYS